MQTPPDTILQKYARLLVHYCLDLQPGERLFVQSTTLAEPLVREIYRTGIRAGAIVETDLQFREQQRILLTEGNPRQLAHFSPAYARAMQEYEAYLYIRAPFNLREEQNVDGERTKARQEAGSALRQRYFERTATRDLKRSLCQFPTQAAAQQAQMSLEEYEFFVYQACGLFAEDPTSHWLQVRQDQQHIVDHLNRCTSVRYVGPDTDICFSTKGRTWINSDGQTNMPSGEVYTSPVEDSVNGHIHFSFPGLYMGHEVEGVTLWVRDGYIEKWEAARGKEFLDYIFSLEGARRFGEAAIGANYGIDRLTRNILFDEKMGGTIHMAVGQSYLQAGGKNQSGVHWDMITDMRSGGQVFADDELIYENGRFLI